MAALVATAVALAAQVTGLLDGPENRAVAARFAIRSPATPDDVIIVAIDDATFADLQRPGPFRDRSTDS